MKKICYFIMISLFSFSCNKVPREQNSEESRSESSEEYFSDYSPSWDGERPADSYNYPVVPGMTEWAILTTAEEQFEALQIPKETLKEMSTQAIIQAILEHPLVFAIFTNGTIYQYSFNIWFTDMAFLEGNNAYMELEKRNDAGIALFDRFILTDPLTGLLTGPPCFESQMVELLISQTAFLSQLTEYDVDLLQHAYKNKELRQKNLSWEIDALGFTTGETTIPLLVGRTMVVAGYSSFVEAVESNEILKFYLDGMYPEGYHEPQFSEIAAFVYGNPYYDDIPQMIINFGNLFLNKK